MIGMKMDGWMEWNVFINTIITTIIIITIIIIAIIIPSMKTVQNEISLVCISITCQVLRLHSLIIVPSSTASVRLKAKVIKTLYFPSSRLWLGPFAEHFQSRKPKGKC